jgi:hypothetical protein
MLVLFHISFLIFVSSGLWRIMKEEGWSEAEKRVYQLLESRRDMFKIYGFIFN